MSLNIQNMKTTSPLADVSIRFGNDQDQYVGLKIAPIKTVPHAQFKFYQYDKSNLRIDEALADSKAQAKKIQYGAFSTSAVAKLRKLAIEVDPMDERDADEVVSDMVTDGTMTLMDKMLLDYENVVNGLVTSSANYENALSSTLGAGLGWSSPSGDPINDSRVARQAVKNACGKYANHAAWSSTALEYLKIHPELVDRVKYTSHESIPEAIIANLMSLDEIFIASAVYNSAANEGASDSLGELWSNQAVFFYRETETPSIRSMHFMTTFAVEEFYTRTYQDQTRGGKEPIEVIESGWQLTSQFVALQDSTHALSAAGYLLQGLF